MTPIVLGLIALLAAILVVMVGIVKDESAAVARQDEHMAAVCRG